MPRPNNEPPILTVKDLDKKRKIIKGRSYANYGLYIGFDGDNLAEINEAKNIAAVKLYFANSTGDMGVQKGVKELFESSNKRIVVHSEDQGCIDSAQHAISPDHNDHAHHLCSHADHRMADRRGNTFKTGAAE